MAEHKLELWILELWIFKDNTTSDFVLGFCHLKHKTAMMSFFRMNIYADFLVYSQDGVWNQPFNEKKLIWRHWYILAHFVTPYILMM